MNTKTKLWDGFYAQLGNIDPNAPLDNTIVRKAMTPSAYVVRAELIAENLKDGDSVLEIGCGYGGLAREILKMVDVSYTVVDNTEMLKQTRKTLKRKVKYVDARKIASLRDKKFTMFVSHFCLSETPQQYREYILKYIIRNCQNISVFDYDDSIVPTASMKSVGLEVLPAVVEKYINKYFDVAKTPSKFLHFQFAGRRNSE